MQLLVVEDDAAIGKAIEKGFEEAGHHCQRVRDGEKGLELARSQKFDGIILDLMLPGLAGLEILRRLRHEGHGTPIILLTALGSVEERVAGLQAGADDYLVKPFAFAELAARVDAVCRRSSLRPASSLGAGPVKLDLATRRVECAGLSVDLTPTEFS